MRVLGAPGTQENFFVTPQPSSCEMSLKGIRVTKMHVSHSEVVCSMQRMAFSVLVSDPCALRKAAPRSQSDTAAMRNQKVQSVCLAQPSRVPVLCSVWLFIGVSPAVVTVAVGTGC